MEMYMDGLLKKLALYQLPHIIDVIIVFVGILAGNFRPLVKVKGYPSASTFSSERSFICEIEFEYSKVGIIWGLMLALLFAHVHFKFVGIRDRIRRCATVEGEQVQDEHVQDEQDQGEQFQGLKQFSQDWYLEAGVVLHAPWVLVCSLKFVLNVWEFLQAVLRDGVDETINFWNQFFFVNFFFGIQLAAITHGMYLVAADLNLVYTVGEALGKKYWAIKKLMQMDEIRKYFY